MAGRQRCQAQQEFHQDKCEVLHVAQENPVQQSGLAAKEERKQLCRKCLLVSKELKRSLCALTAREGWLPALGTAFGVQDPLWGSPGQERL